MGRWETKRASEIVKVRTRCEQQRMALDGAQRRKITGCFNRFVQRHQEYQKLLNSDTTGILRVIELHNLAKILPKLRSGRLWPICFI